MPVTSEGFRSPVLTATANVPRDIGYLADDVNATIVAIKAAWTEYTPTLTATNSPTLGTGAITGRYKQVGKHVTAKVRVQFGTGFATGSGTYVISLPASPNTATYGQYAAVGVGTAGDTSSSVRPLTALLTAARTAVMLQLPTYALLDNTGPTAAWTATGWIEVTVTYEAA